MQEIYLQSRIYSGSDSLSYLDALNGHKIFLVTDPFMQDSGMINYVLERVTQDNQIEIFTDITPDPPVEIVTKGIVKLQEFGADCMIALGGGSAIDAAKAMKFFALKSEPTKKLEFIAIPTTSGTGSEVTDFAVITNQQTGTKYPLVDRMMLPDIAILDSSLVLSVPPIITADTGIDVLTHCLEAYVSKKATAFSDAYAEKAFVAVFDYLERAYRDGEDQEAREQMHIASCMAGLAFNQASLGLNHGMAHAIGARLHVAHGRLNGILLSAVIQFNAADKRAEQKYAQLYRLIAADASSSNKMAVRQLINRVKRLLTNLKMPTHLTETQITKQNLEQVKQEVIQASLADGCTITNPVEATPQQVELLLTEIC